jgi:hypothetical protein
MLAANGRNLAVLLTCRRTLAARYPPCSRPVPCCGRAAQALSDLAAARGAAAASDAERRRLEADLVGLRAWLRSMEGIGAAHQAALRRADDAPVPPPRSGGAAGGARGQVVCWLPRLRAGRDRPPACLPQGPIQGGAEVARRDWVSC